MRIDGKVLFAGPAIVSQIEEQALAQARDGVMTHLLSDADLTRLTLRKAILKMVHVDDAPQLLSATPVVETVLQGGPIASCDLLFSGNWRYFHSSTPTWPMLRRVCGTVMKDRIRLSAEGWGSGAAWLPALLAAEAATIDLYLVEQSLAVDRFNEGKSKWARALVSRIYPRIDRGLVQLLSGWQAMSPRRFKGELDALWRKWIA